MAEGNSASSFCCLCRRPFQNKSGFKKRKRLHGEGCKESKQLLDEILSECCCLSLSSFVETKDTAAFLCNLCDGQALKILKHQCEIKRIEDNILEMVSNLTTFDTSIDLRRKRPQAAENVNRKRTRLSIDDTPPVDNSVSSPSLSTPLVTSQQVDVYCQQSSSQPVIGSTQSSSQPTVHLTQSSSQGSCSSSNSKSPSVMVSYAIVFYILMCISLCL